MTRRKLRRNAKYFRGLAMIASETVTTPCKGESEEPRVAEHYDAGQFMSPPYSTSCYQHPTALDYTIYSSGDSCKVEVDW